MKTIVDLFKFGCIGCTIVLCCIFPLIALLSFIVCTVIYLLWNEDSNGNLRTHKEIETD